MAEEIQRKMPAWLKIAVEWGPLVAFFIANARGGIFVATGVFMAATIVALVVAWVTTHRIAMVPLVSAIFVALFGALTLWLQDEVFIKVKVTLVNALFGTILLVGLAFGRQFLKLLLGETLKMDDEGWRKLTLRWGAILLRCRRPQRNGVAHGQHRRLGHLQGVRHPAADAAFRPLPGSVDAKTHAAGRQRGTLGCPAASVFPGRIGERCEVFFSLD